MSMHIDWACRYPLDDIRDLKRITAERVGLTSDTRVHPFSCLSKNDMEYIDRVSSPYDLSEQYELASMLLAVRDAANNAK